MNQEIDHEKLIKKFLIKSNNIYFSLTDEEKSSFIEKNQNYLKSEFRKFYNREVHGTSEESYIVENDYYQIYNSIFGKGNNKLILNGFNLKNKDGKNNILEIIRDKSINGSIEDDSCFGNFVDDENKFRFLTIKSIKGYIKENVYKEVVFYMKKELEFKLDRQINEHGQIIEKILSKYSNCYDLINLQMSKYINENNEFNNLLIGKINELDEIYIENNSNYNTENRIFIYFKNEEYLKEITVNNFWSDTVRAAKKPENISDCGVDKNIEKIIDELIKISLMKMRRLIEISKNNELNENVTNIFKNKEKKIKINFWKT